MPNNSLARRRPGMSDWDRGRLARPRARAVDVGDGRRRSSPAGMVGTRLRTSGRARRLPSPGLLRANDNSRALMAGQARHRRRDTCVKVQKDLLYLMCNSFS